MRCFDWWDAFGTAIGVPMPKDCYLWAMGEALQHGEPVIPI